MTRKWRLGRVVLASILVTLASLACWLWPPGPACHLPSEPVVGFDEAHGLLWTRPAEPGPPQLGTGNPSIALRAYDVATGGLRAEATIAPTGQALQDTRDILLSPDGSSVAAWNNIDEVLTVHSLATGVVTWRAALARLSMIDSIGFSRNGQYLAARCVDTVSLRDARTGELLREASMPAGLVALSRSGPWTTWPLRIDVTVDGRFLATAGDQPGVAVFDMTSGRLVGNCPKACACRFVDGGSTLVTFPAEHDVPSAEVRWYVCSAEGVREREDLRFSAWQRMAVAGFGGGTVVGVAAEPPSQDPPLGWLPAAWQSAVRGRLGLGRNTLRLDFAERGTGRLTGTLRLGDDGGFMAVLSPSGRLLAARNNGHITIWHLPLHRPLTCWLTCAALALLAAWGACPRKGKGAAPFSGGLNALPRRGGLLPFQGSC